ncbi:hypothetical protein ACFLYW_01015 [Thermodesulfobacteriota bacterium]
MIVDKRKYHTIFKEIMERYYSVLKEVGNVPTNWEGYVDGYIEVGLLLGITSSDELDVIIKESNYRVFGMSVEERRKKYRTITAVDENDLDIPTFIREGKSLEF